MKKKLMLEKKKGDNKGSCPHVPATFISSNIPAAADYGVYISQLVRYRRACAQYNVFLDKTQLLTQKLNKTRLRYFYIEVIGTKFYGRHHDLVGRYEISISQMAMDRLLFM
jgi:hypothetical protein